MNRAIRFAAIVGIALGPSLLFAQPPGRGGPPGMGGRGVSPMEMIVQLFDRADVNRDGCVTKAELTAAMQSQNRGNQLGRGGPPPQGGNFGQANQQAQNQPPQGDGHNGPPPEPGQVLPEPIAQMLNLTDRQTRRLKVLQEDVDKRLAAILTEEQQEQLKTARPPHGPDRADAGDRGIGRPLRPN